MPGKSYLLALTFNRLVFSEQEGQYGKKLAALAFNGLVFSDQEGQYGKS